MGDPTRASIEDAPDAPGPERLWEELVQLLRRADLPVDDLEAAELGSFALARKDGRLVGSGALEVYGGAALVRSVAVDPAERGNGLGRRIVEHLEQRARSRGLSRLYLLTTTAERFFLRAGYMNLPRDEAPLAIRTSAQFSSLCPDSAAFMGKVLDPTVLP